jgi:hypothetical protein
LGYGRKVWTLTEGTLTPDSLSPYCSLSIVDYDYPCGGQSQRKSVAGVWVGPTVVAQTCNRILSALRRGGDGRGI